MSSWKLFPKTLFIATGWLVFVSVSTSPIQPNYGSGSDRLREKSNSAPIAIPSSSGWNEFYTTDRGTIPAWVSPDGLMRVPSVQSDFEMDDFARLTDAGRINRNFGVPVPGISPKRIVRTAGEDPLTRFADFVPSLHHQMAARGKRTKSFHDRRSSQQDCIGCLEGFLSPTLTYADGSDVFKYDLFNPYKSYPSDFNESNIKAPSNCFFNTDWPGHLVCQDKVITKVPDNLPAVPLSIFELNNTGVQSLQNGDFNLMDVVVMNLQNNLIETMEKGSFRGISNLQSLFIKYNRVNSLNWQVFDGLTALVVLSLRGNQIDLSESFNTTAEKTAILPNLTHLDLSENPLGALNQYVFSELEGSPIEELNLKSCKLTYIDQDAFEPLKSLLHVDFYNNPGLFSTFYDDAKAPRLPPFVMQVGLGFNRFVQRVPVSLLQNVSDTLLVLNLSGNYFVSLTNSVIPGSTFPNLQYLILEACSISIVNRSAFEDMHQLMSLYLGKNLLTGLAPQVFPPSLQLLSLRQNPQVIGTFTLKKDSLAGLTNLTWLDMSYMQLDSSNLSADVFVDLRKLNFLQMRQSGVSQIPAFLFSPLGELLVLDLGQNSDLAKLPTEFSYGLSKTLFLFLDRCSLDFPSNERVEEQPFHWMTALVALYMSQNKINHFPSSLVANLTQLNILYLMGNQIITWQLGTTASMTNDAAIDVSDNRISYLPKQTYQEFSTIGAIDLSDNALPCNCQTLELQQLAIFNDTEVLNWDNDAAYLCTDTYFDPPIVKQIQFMSEEEFHCETREVTTSDPDPGPKGETMTIVSSAVGTVIIVVLVLGTVGICYKRRHYNNKQQWFHFRQFGLASVDFRSEKSSDDENHNEYEYDAFISFNEQDRHWVYTHLVPQLEPPKGSLDSTEKSLEPSFHLCLHDRDFIVGQQITENIIENIAKSRKIVIVLSRSYVESKWCQFELHLSQHRLLESERRNALVLILLEDVPKQQQNAGLRFLLSTRTYLAWRTDPEGQILFWQRLRHVLTVRPHSCSSTSTQTTTSTTP